MKPIFSKILSSILGVIVGLLALIGPLVTSEYRYIHISSFAVLGMLYILQFAIIVSLVNLLIYYAHNKQKTEKNTYFTIFACIGFVIAGAIYFF